MEVLYLQENVRKMISRQYNDLGQGTEKIEYWHCLGFLVLLGIRVPMSLNRSEYKLRYCYTFSSSISYIFSLLYVLSGLEKFYIPNRSGPVSEHSTSKQILNKQTFSEPSLDTTFKPP